MQEILKYQDIDFKIAKLENELKELPELKKAKEMQNLKADCRNRLDVLEKNAQKALENFEKARQYYDELVVKIETLSKSVDEYDLEKIKKLQQAKNNFYQMVEKLESELVKIVNQFSKVNNDYSAIVKNVKIANGNIEVYKQKYEDAKAQIEPKIAELKKELTEQAKKVDKAILEKYNLRKKHGLPVFVKNINGTCGRCRMTISASKMQLFEKNGYVECENENCGRIIIKM